MFQRICAVAMFVAALFVSVIPNADARIYYDWFAL